ncbi:hypothetical protein [Georgenia subflava]|uniref:DUF3137 domain-containing protein n=1 Tax=Georgenia subflava TaxID=1622177 RepID=A0A6N7EFK6_9MICO|nr:hypothetical protein [Georgenia subflava]MPV36171.1 hypothetical protein [Georgenia subflava]
MGEGLSTGTMWLLGLGLVVVIAVGVWLQTRKENRFQERKQGMARRGGWQRLPVRVSTEDWSGAPFRPDERSYASEVTVADRDGLRVFFLDYTFESTDQIMADGRDAKHSHLVVGVDLPASLPEVSFDTGLVAGLTTAVGGQDVTVGHPEIDRTWRITSPDERFVTDLVRGPVADALTDPALRGARLRIVGSSVLLWDKGFDLDKVPGTVQRVEPALVTLARAIPEQVLRAHGGPPRPLLPAA